MIKYSRILAILVTALLLPIAANASAVLTNVTPLISTTGAPSDPMYLSNPGGVFNGVAKLAISTTVGTFGCSASLIDADDLLTAAHCLDPRELGGAVLGITATFAAPGSTGATYTAASWAFNPLFTTDLFSGNDIGMIELTADVAGITPYTLFSGLGYGSTADIAGYGVAGTGATGELGGFGTFRHGLNEFDGTVHTGGFVLPGTAADNIFLYDFDNGTAGCNTDAAFGLPSSTGLGLSEVMITHGDSGGPSFIGGMLAGVHSFGSIAYDPTKPAPAACPTATTFSAFGSLGGDGRIAAAGNAAFIAAFQAGEVPEPASILLLASALALLPLGFRRQS